MNKRILQLLILLAFGQAAASDLESGLQTLGAGEPDRSATESYISQERGMSLSQAVDSVRRRPNVERIVSAETKVEGGREVHHIRYMTKDGKVRHAKIPGRRR